jgi:hypothetical protein
VCDPESTSAACHRPRSRYGSGASMKPGQGN